MVHHRVTDVSGRRAAGGSSSFRWIERGGEYFRLADPGWADPLDGTYAREHGGRWNAPGSFPVVYLNATRSTARANVARKLAGRPFGVEDLAPEEAPDLVATRVPRDRYVDIVTDEGCTTAGLPATYPRDARGEEIGWDACQPVGRRAWDADASGIACRSAAVAAGKDGEELAWFERGGSLTPDVRWSFDEWFWGR